MFKAERVRDTITCTKCSKVGCIYSKFSLRSGKNTGLSKLQVKEALAKLELFKNGDYVCGDECTVEPFKTKRLIRCGQFVESAYYGYANGSGTLDVICCFCGSDDNFVPQEEVELKMNLTNMSPLPICQDCYERGITPPTVKAKTNFFKVGVRKQKKKQQ